MSTLIAKPIVKDQYWVVTDGEKKVGNVIADGNGFDLKVNGINTHFKDTIEITKQQKIQFEKIKTKKQKSELPFSDYPIIGKVYNSLLDIKRKLHLFTKTQKSKCYYAAGYFVMNQNGYNEIILCPKYIFVQRYKYIGPFKTEDEAKSQINNL